MLVNHANIANLEERFLSFVIIWEWLYPHLINPNGATPDDESSDLGKIIEFILNHYWPKKYNFKIKSKNIFVVLKNQLAHSSKLPINRDYAEEWMKQLLQDEIEQYMKLFQILTQLVVLKTLNINAEKMIYTNLNINNFLTLGRLCLSII